MAAVSEQFSEHGNQCARLGLGLSVQIAIKSQMPFPFHHNIAHRSRRAVLTD